MVNIQIESDNHIVNQYHVKNKQKLKEKKSQKSSSFSASERRIGELGASYESYIEYKMKDCST